MTHFFTGQTLYVTVLCLNGRSLDSPILRYSGLNIKHENPPFAVVQVSV